MNDYKDDNNLDVTNPAPPLSGDTAAGYLRQYVRRAVA